MINPSKLSDDGVSGSALVPERLVEVLRADQRRRWKSGQALPVMSYLNRFPRVMRIRHVLLT